MRTHTIRAVSALVGVFALAACGETTLETDLENLTVEEQAELAVLSDPGSFEVALELSETTADVAAESGRATGQGRALLGQARVLFSDARARWMDGDHQAALQAARQARRLVAEALREIGGDGSLEALIERIEALALTADDEVFDDADAVRAELERIAAEARVLLEQGDTLAAAARAVLGEQIARHRRGRRDHPDISVDRARLAVSLAGSAVALAERIISSDMMPPESDAAVTDAPERRNRWLVHAKRSLAKAERALASGHMRRAVHFAQHAQWSALKAVVLPGGIHEEEIRVLVGLAEDLLVEAREAVGEDDTELRKRLLNHAADLLELGIAKLEEGHVRGVAAVWRSAVVSAWLIA